MQVLASNVTANDFQDVAAFLNNGGQRGPQRQILREGTYAINLAQFVVITEERVYYLPLSRDDQTVIQSMAKVIAERDGFTPVVHQGLGRPDRHRDRPRRPLAAVRRDHRAHRGRRPDQRGDLPQQLPDARPLPEGRRPARAPAAGAGRRHLLPQPAVCHRRDDPQDHHRGRVPSAWSSPTPARSAPTCRARTTGTASWWRRGNRGVWSEPLLPGKYAFNTYAGKVIIVPTTNIILKWIRSEVGSHHFDENLSEVSLITKDAFEPSLPLSVVIHIDYQKAPLVIQRFGDVKKLVEQTLDPMVSAYFKNIGQTRTLIQLIQERNDIQQHLQPGDEGKVHPLQPGAGRGADRHADHHRRRQADRDHPEPAARPARSRSSRSRPTPARRRRRPRNASCAKPRRAPSSSATSPNRS